MTPWTDQNIEILRKHYAAGLTYVQIAAAMGVTRDAVGGQLAKHGICNRSNDAWWTEERLERLRIRYLRGDSFSQLAREMDTTRSAVAGKIKRLGINRDPTGPRKDCVRDDLRRAKISRLASESYAAREYVKPTAKPKPVPVFVEPRRVSFADMQFSQFCAYPVHGDGEPASYCGHDRGFTLEGKQSSYCPGHHRLTHREDRAR